MFSHILHKSFLISKLIQVCLKQTKNNEEKKYSTAYSTGKILVLLILAANLYFVAKLHLSLFNNINTWYEKKVFRLWLYISDVLLFYCVFAVIIWWRVFAASIWRSLKDKEAMKDFLRAIIEL